MKRRKGNYAFIGSYGKKINPYVMIILSFILLILVGSFLLFLPIANENQDWGNYIDCLFTATSAGCVTGLSTHANGIGNQYTLFGEIVICILIQIGGLGFITFVSFLVTLISGKIVFKDRYVLSLMVNCEDVGKVVTFIRKIIALALGIELLGFALGIPAMLTIYPDNIGKALWNSYFMSISAFNNAGFDLFGNCSLILTPNNPLLFNMPQWAYYYMISYIMILIVLGGIGFAVIFDVFNFKKKIKQWSFTTKIVLTTTLTLIVGGFLLMWGLNARNGMGPVDALFQSITCRTAGFITYNQADLTTSGLILSSFLMFIGGSPMGTAGGIKTTTLFVLVLGVYSFISGKPLKAFNKGLSGNMVLKAMTVFVTSLLIVIIAFLGISAIENNNTFANAGIEDINKELAIGYEVFSAFGTVGNTVGITPFFSAGSKVILCALMFIGRIGPFTFFHIVSKNMENASNVSVKYIEEDVLIG